MNWDLMVFLIKIAGFLSACGGPIMIADRLKGALGTPTAVAITFFPIILMIGGAFHLTAAPGDRWARWAVELGRVGMYVMVGMQFYGIWLILGGFRSPALPLYYTGIATGLLSAIAYAWLAARWIAKDRAASAASDGRQDHQPIEPS